MDEMTELAKAFSEKLDREITKLRNKVGTVTAFTSATPFTVTVTVDGTSLVLHRLATYSAPAVSDNVLIDVSIQNWVVLGKIQP
jgi:hypothetical protein